MTNSSSSTTGGGPLLECPYVYTPTPFARGRHSTVHHARRRNVPESETGNVFAVKLISKTNLIMDYFELPAADRARMTKEEQADWDADVLKTIELMLQPLLKELFVIKRLNEHPHVLHYVDHFWTKSKLNIVTELALGRDLQYRLRRRISERRGGFPEAELIPMFRILCDTFIFIHSKQCVHRDLKPSNILFRTQGADELVIGDFGFSAMMEEHRPDLTTTNTGTARFMAPEQANRMPHGSPVDMWALGVNCYYLLTTHHPIRPPPYGEVDETEPYLIDQEGINNINWANVSSLARSFIQNLLMMDPTKRMTAEEARMHPWLADVEGGRREP